MSSGSTWLVLAAIVLAVNPWRLHGRLPRSREVAVGAAIAAGLYLLLATVADGLLEAIDVSAPTMRVAAGLVLLAGAGRDLLVGPPAAEPALPGWRAALIPVALPMLARPQVGVLALSAGATEGPAVVAVGAAAMGLVALGVGAAGSRRVRPAARAVDWLAVAAAMATMAIGVAFVVEGVLSV